jgi:hypothetical protein
MADRNETGDDLSIRDAARLFDLSIGGLEGRLRRGEVAGEKVPGPHGREWRVSAAALDEFGFQRRSQEAAYLPDSEGLRAEIRRLAGIATYERRRADEANRGLGEAVLEIARLRAALRSAPESQPHRLDPYVDSGPSDAEAPAVWSPPHLEQGAETIQ